MSVVNSQSPLRFTGSLTSFSPLVLVVSVIYEPFEVHIAPLPISSEPTLEPSFQYEQS